MPRIQFSDLTQTQKWLAEMNKDLLTLKDLHQDLVELGLKQEHPPC